MGRRGVGRAAGGWAVGADGWFEWAGECVCGRGLGRGEGRRRGGGGGEGIEDGDGGVGGWGQLLRGAGGTGSLVMCRFPRMTVTVTVAVMYWVAERCRGLCLLRTCSPSLYARV
jgi:hypothetical protein